MNLIYETRAGVLEQAFLFEVVLGSREVRDGPEVRYGPLGPGSMLHGANDLVRPGLGWPLHALGAIGALGEATGNVDVPTASQPSSDAWETRGERAAHDAIVMDRRPGR